jgi:hypothetical protein
LQLSIRHEPSERTLENVEYRDPKHGMMIPRLTIMRRMRTSINALSTSGSRQARLPHCTQCKTGLPYHTTCMPTEDASASLLVLSNLTTELTAWSRGFAKLSESTNSCTQWPRACHPGSKSDIQMYRGHVRGFNLDAIQKDLMSISVRKSKIKSR